MKETKDEKFAVCPCFCSSFRPCEGIIIVNQQLSSRVKDFAKFIQRPTGLYMQLEACYTTPFMYKGRSVLASTISCRLSKPQLYIHCTHTSTCIQAHIHALTSTSTHTHTYMQKWEGSTGFSVLGRVVQLVYCYKSLTMPKIR